MKRLCALLLLLAGALIAFSAGAQDYPSRGVRLLVGSAQGGPVDTAARVTGLKLAESWQQAVTIENRVGASEMIAAEYVAKAAPDGYTLLVAALNVVTINPVVFTKLPYDPVKGFAPVSLLTRNAMVLVANPKSPFKSLRALIEAAKAKPGDIQYATPGLATANHIATEWLAAEAGIELFHVPFKGGPAAANAIIAGDVPIGVVSLIQALPLVKGGQMRALAVTTGARTSLAPDMPTVAESGVAGFDASLQIALFAPAGTPADIVVKLNADVNRLLGLADTRDRFAAMGVEPVGSTPAELVTTIATLRRKIERVVEAAKIKVQ
jgi:tripartite-type tricarboxylate transporter receptor subunit TctC